MASFWSFTILALFLGRGGDESAPPPPLGPGLKAHCDLPDSQRCLCVACGTLEAEKGGEGAGARGDDADPEREGECGEGGAES